MLKYGGLNQPIPNKDTSICASTDFLSKVYKFIITVRKSLP
jgi:hypothetical protein